MKHNIILSDDEYKAVIEQFYNYFEDGYKFERFLKIYLEKIGLQEVVVTPCSRDGGIDLMAVRYGIGDLGGQDYIKYCVQAKRYKPSSNISIDTVKAFAYNAAKHNSTGIFITTAKFSKPIHDEFDNLKNPPIILIDGKTLVDSCIDNELGFVYKPIFNSQSMDEAMNKLMQSENTSQKQMVMPTKINENIIEVEKKITTNDVRARILSIPKIIIEHIPIQKTVIDVCFNGEFNAKLTINKGRNYFARITPVYRKYGLLTKDNSIIPANSLWKLEDGKLDISISLL